MNTQRQTQTDEADRVRRNSPVVANRQIDARLGEAIEHYRGRPTAAVVRRVQALDREWDVERVLETNAASLALAGVVLGATVDRRWLVLPGVVLGFLLLHATEGWCPPLPVLRERGVRTRGEIDREKYALLRELEKRTSTSAAAAAQP